MVIPLKGDKFKLITVLRSLSLMDGQFTHVSKNNNLFRGEFTNTGYQKAMTARTVNGILPKAMTLKRRLGYDDEEGATRSKLSRMILDD